MSPPLRDDETEDEEEDEYEDEAIDEEMVNMSLLDQVFMWKCFAILGCTDREGLQHLLVAIALETLERSPSLNRKEMSKKTLEHVETLLGPEASKKFRKIVL